MKIILLILYTFIVFIVGAGWLQTKETKFGIKARFICEKCEATGCQAKWCKMRRVR